MDLTKELKEINISENFTKVREEIKDQLNMLIEKQFIIQVLEIACMAEKIYKETIYENNNINSIKLSWYHDHDIGNVMESSHLENNGQKFIKPEKKISDFASKIISIIGFDETFISESLEKKGAITIEINENIKENILNALLSKKLKSILNYNELQVNTTNLEKETKHKKIKL